MNKKEIIQRITQALTDAKLPFDPKDVEDLALEMSTRAQEEITELLKKTKELHNTIHTFKQTNNKEEIKALQQTLQELKNKIDTNTLLYEKAKETGTWGKKKVEGRENREEKRENKKQ